MSIVSRIVGFIFFLAAIAFLSGILYSQTPWIIRAYTWKSATGVIDDMSESSGESVLTIRLTEQDGTERTVKKQEYLDSETDLFIGKSVDLIYEPGNPNDIFFKVNILGLFIGILFLFCFGFFGLVLCFNAVKQIFDHWNRGYRLLWLLLIAMGFLAAYLVVNPGEPSDDSAIDMDSIWVVQLIYGTFAIGLLGAGITGIYNLTRKSRKRQALILKGRRIETSDFKVVAQHANTFPGDEINNPTYIIRCQAPESGTNLPFVFESEPLNFDPAPYMKATVTILVNPSDVTDYMVEIGDLVLNHKEVKNVGAGVS